jgi:phage-related holin
VKVFIDAFIHFFNRIGEYPAIKLLTGIFIWFLSVFYGDFNPAYTAIIAFIVADWVSAIWFARVDPGSKVESSKMKEGIVKLFIYAAALSAGHFCSFIPVVSPLEAYIQGYIGVTELISLCENGKKLADHYHKKIPLIDLITGFLQGRLKKMEEERHEQN